MKITVAYNDKDLVLNADSIHIKQLANTLVVYTKSGTYYIVTKGISDSIKKAVLNSTDFTITNVTHFDKKRRETKWN